MKIISITSAEGWVLESGNVPILALALGEDGNLYAYVVKGKDSAPTLLPIQHGQNPIKKL